MTVRSIEDIRRDHDDYRRWQVRPKRNPLANPIPASWRDVGLLLTYAEGFEKLREENERLTAENSELRRLAQNVIRIVDRDQVDIQALKAAVSSQQSPPTKGSSDA